MPKELAIAVIEDNSSFRSALVEALCSLGYGARGFESAEAFIADNGEENCDRIITDIDMPGMSGFELKRLLAKRGSTRPVIMVTALADAGLKAEAKASGAICLLQKPFDLDALVDCLERRSNF
jgi:FixJ family two-component response regulator